MDVDRSGSHRHHFSSKVSVRNRSEVFSRVKTAARTTFFLNKDDVISIFLDYRKDILLLLNFYSLLPENSPSSPLLLLFFIMVRYSSINCI